VASLTPFSPRVDATVTTVVRSGGGGAGNGSGFDPAALYAGSRNGVVTIESTFGVDDQTAGSGFVVNARRGLIATASHVVTKAQKGSPTVQASAVYVVLGDGTRVDAHVLGYDLFNEPWAGLEWPSCLTTGCESTYASELQPAMTRGLDAVRQADGTNIVWWEPQQFAGGQAVDTFFTAPGGFSPEPTNTGTRSATARRSTPPAMPASPRMPGRPAMDMRARRPRAGTTASSRSRTSNCATPAW